MATNRAVVYRRDGERALASAGNRSDCYRVEAPLYLRQRVLFLDAKLEAGTSLALPDPPGFDAVFLYVFRGEIGLNGHVLSRGDGANFTPGESREATTASGAELVLFCIDTAHPASRSGTLSG